MNIKKFKLYIIHIIGIFMLLLYIWTKYIHSRIPRDIPFNLSLMSLLILTITCATFIVLIKKLIKPQTSILLFEISKGIQRLFKPLYLVDSTIKQLSTFKYLLQNISYYLSYINYTKPLNMFKGYLIFQYFPKICLLTLLSLDIFYFQKI